MSDPARPVRNILALAGDGIGPEVMTATRRVMAWFETAGRARFNVTEGLIGGASYDAHGEPLTTATVAAAKRADAVLLACIGGPQYDQLPYDKRPERGLLGSKQTSDAPVSTSLKRTRSQVLPPFLVR